MWLFFACSHSYFIHYCPSSPFLLVYSAHIHIPFSIVHLHPLLFILFTFTLHSPLAHINLNCFFILIHIHISFTLCPSSLFIKQITNVLFLFFYSYSLNLPVTNRVVYGGPSRPHSNSLPLRGLRVNDSWTQLEHLRSQHLWTDRKQHWWSWLSVCCWRTVDVEGLLMFDVWHLVEAALMVITTLRRHHVWYSLKEELCYYGRVLVTAPLFG